MLYTIRPMDRTYILNPIKMTELHAEYGMELNTLKRFIIITNYIYLFQYVNVFFDIHMMIVVK